MKAIIYILVIVSLTACGAKGPLDKEVQNEDGAKGVYEPFSTDNVVPYQDNDNDYYPLYYYH